MSPALPPPLSGTAGQRNGGPGMSDADQDQHDASAAALDALGAFRDMDRLWREHARRRITDEAFLHAQRRWGDFVRANRATGINPAALRAAANAILAEALSHAPEPRPLPPLPAGRIGPPEVVALLRRVLAGEARVAMVAPPLRWSDVFHMLGDVTVEGWRLTFFRRGQGVKYVDEAVAPDGRRSRYPDLDAREGNPVFLLDDDEQDRLDDLMDALHADPDATRVALEEDDRAGFPNAALSAVRLLCWAEMTRTGDGDRTAGLRGALTALQLDVALTLAKARRGAPETCSTEVARAEWLGVMLGRLGAALDKEDGKTA